MHMVKALQDLGDRIVGHFVPTVAAEGSTQDYTVRCGCYTWQGTSIEYRKSCVAGSCGPCYETGPC